MIERKSARMRNHRGGVIAAGVLCAIAATVAVWSGPLAAASDDLRAAAGTMGTHQTAQTHSTSSTNPRSAASAVSK